MAPAFSPDGSRIAYTVDIENTWSVPVLAGGKPEPMLSKAAGLTWIDAHRILFSEQTPRGMGLETALENRAFQREIYMPNPLGMAHFSSLSPDGKQLLVVEMVGIGPWLPCRLMPFDESSTGRQVGPQNKPVDRKNLPATELPPRPVQCTAAAWSPDGKWMYFTVSDGHGSHIWRQRVDSDKPEQITSGLTEERGLAIGPNAKSLFTSVGANHGSLWIHDAKGERQISREGQPSGPHFSPDGTRVYYMVDTGDNLEVWVTDLKTGFSERALPATAPVTFFTLSSDGKSVLYGALNRKVWIAALDPPSPPRQVPVDDGKALFSPPVYWGPSGRLYFAATAEGKTHFFTMNLDGSDRHQGLPDSAFADNVDWRFVQVSPDERWVIHGGVTSPLAGGPSFEVCACSHVGWSTDGKAALFTFRSIGNGNGVGKTVAVPLKVGESFPSLPPGRHTLDELAKIPGAIVIPEFADMGPGMSSWVYMRNYSQQNIFEIPMP